MISPPEHIGQREIPFSDVDFQKLAKLARSDFGLNLPPNKKPLVYSRLVKRLRAHGMASFPDYLHLLDNDQSGLERKELVSALTTNVSSFFRERHHFDTLGSFLETQTDVPRLRIWSAGCSSGQEPYSISATIHTRIDKPASRDIKILATDIDSKIVTTARRGVYSGTEACDLAPADQEALFTPEGAGGERKIRPELQALISYAELNLIGTWPFRGPFDAIFCRNVAIYFDQEVQQTLWTRFCNFLKPGGYLFIGHSERISGPASAQFEIDGVTTYRKTIPGS